MKYIWLMIVVAISAAANTAPKILVDGQQLLKSIAHAQATESPNIYDWKITPDGPEMIEWDPEGNKWTGDGYIRKGKIYLSNKGKITHHVVDSNVRQGYWDLQFYAKRSQIDHAVLKPSSVTQENPHIDLDIVNIKEKVVCNDNSTNKITGYLIKYPNKESFWMLETTEISSKGSASSYDITFDRKPDCVVKKLEDEAETQRLEEKRKKEEAKLAKAKKELEILRMKKEQLEKIREANEELKKQEMEKINLLKHELEGLLDQKVDMESMVGKQESYNHKQQLQLLQSKIDMIKYQKEMASKIRSVKSDIDLLDKELKNAKVELSNLKKDKQDKDKVKYIEESIEVKKRLLEQNKYLMESYINEEKLRRDKERIGEHIGKSNAGNSRVYTVRSSSLSKESMDEKVKKCISYRENLTEKISKTREDIAAIKHDIESVSKENLTDTDKKELAASKKRLLQKTKLLLQSYLKEKEENNLVIEQIEIEKKREAKPILRKDRDKKIDSPVIALGTFLSEYISSGNSNEHLEENVHRYFMDTIHPYYKIRSASQWDVIADKRKYFQRWPNRHFKMTKYKVVDRFEHDGLQYKEVILDLDWRVSSPKRGTRKGHSVVNIILVERGNNYKITGMRNLDIQRSKVHKVKKLQPSYGNEYDDGMKHMAFEDQGVLIRVAYPGFAIPGESFVIKASMTNRSGTARQGGLTLSFPDMENMSGKIIHSTFASTHGYSYPDPIFSNITHSQMATEYFMVEGWHKHRWKYGKTKYFTISLATPTNISTLKVNVRGILWIRNKYDTRKAPADSYAYDQQGFAVRQIEIPIQYPE